jgi:hypothetical protein
MAFFSLGGDDPDIEPGPLSHWLEDFSYNDDIMDIGSGNAYPSNALSNFAPHPFEIDGVKCNSMEGFLQSLKFESKEMQEYVCTLVGYSAKKKDPKRIGNNPRPFIGEGFLLKEILRNIRIFLIVRTQNYIRIQSLKRLWKLPVNQFLRIQLVNPKYQKLC